MPYRRKDSSIWWVSYVEPGGQRVRRTTGTTDKKEAEALEAKWKLEAFRERHWGEEPRRGFSELMLAYLQATADEKRSHERDLISARHLRGAFRRMDLRALAPTDIRDYVARRRASGVGPATIYREIGLLSSAINWARRELEWKLPNPVQERKLRAPEGRIRWITREQANRLLEAASREPKAAHLVDFIRLALNTGMRRGEILGLEWKRVDLEENLIYLDSSDQKNGKAGSVPLNQEARSALVSRSRFHAEHCPSSQWVFAHASGARIRSVKRAFRTATKRAGIEDFRIHDLRHTCAAWLAQAGVSIRDVAELLRHSDIRVTMRYAHLAPENVRAAVNSLGIDESRSGHGVG